MRTVKDFLLGFNIAMSGMLVIAISFVLFTFSVAPPQATALINPVLKECIQRGYKDVYRNYQTYCVFPDGSECLIEEFNNGSCGQNFMTQRYCVTEGNYVWDENACCPGLKYTPPNVPGQATCQKDYQRDMYYKLFFLIGQLIIGSFIFMKIARKEYRIFK